MAVRTYDPKDVSILVGGVPIKGFADGEFVRVNKKSDAFTLVVGSDGVVSRAASNDNTGEMVIMLSQTSPSNDTLSALHLADLATKSGVVPILITDNSGRSVYVSAFGWIRKLPDSSFGKDITNREWNLDMADFSAFIGGNPDVEA